MKPPDNPKERRITANAGQKSGMTSTPKEKNGEVA